MVKVGLLRFGGGGDDEDRGLLASGEVDGRKWQLRYLEQFGPAGRVLVFTVHSSVGSARGDSCFGMARLDRARSFLIGMSAAGEHRFVWGLAPRDAVAVRVLDEVGASHVVSVGGDAVDGLAPFVVVLEAVAVPAAVQALGRDGGEIASESVRPPPPTDTGFLSRLESRALNPSIQRPDGTAIIEGRVDGHAWYFSADRRGDELALGMSVRAPTGGGSSSGTGPVPEPTAACRVGVSGSGSSGDCWHLHGWADLTIDRIALCMRSGDVLELPVAGRGLDLGVGLFAIALPNDARGFTLEAFDAYGALVDRCWLASSLAMTEASIEEVAEQRQRAQTPPPAAVEALWEQVTGEALAAVRAPDHYSSAIGPLDADELSGRWPVRPLLRPIVSEAYEWMIVARHSRSDRGRSVNLAVRTILGPAPRTLGVDEPDIDDGSIVMTQGVWWAEPPGHRDPPNSTVRGQPARLDVYTREENNFEEISLSWDEAATDLDPSLHGLAVAIRAHPYHHTPEEILELAEQLQLDTE